MSNHTMQDLIVDRLTERLTAAGATFTFDYGYANVGTIRVLDPDTLAVTVAVDFDFQDDNVHFDVHPRVIGGGTTVACHHYGRARQKGQIDAVKDSPGEVIDAVIAYLANQGAKR